MVKPLIKVKVKIRNRAHNLSSVVQALKMKLEQTSKSTTVIFVKQENKIRPVNFFQGCVIPKMMVEAVKNVAAKSVSITKNSRTAPPSE